MKPRTRYALRVLVLFCLPGCQFIAEFDTSGLGERTFDGGCYQNLAAAPGTPIGVIVFDSRAGGVAISGRGSGFFGHDDWTFSEIGDSGALAERAQIEIQFGDDTAQVTVQDRTDGIELENLPLDDSSIALSPCRDTVGIYHQDTRQVFLWNTLKAEAPEVAERFDAVGEGVAAGPVAGDWDNDGYDSYGVYDRDSFTFHLHGDAEGEPDRTVVLSSIPPGQTTLPVAGDWNNDGQDSVGVYLVELGRFHLFENLDPTQPLIPFEVGPGGATGVFPVAGGWDGVAGDSVGIWELSSRQFRFVNVNAPGGAESVCSPGVTFDGTWPLAGDWTADGRDALGLYHRQTGTFLFYEMDLTAGTCELIYELGLADAADNRYLPIAGNWDNR